MMPSSKTNLLKLAIAGPWLLLFVGIMNISAAIAGWLISWIWPDG